MIEAVQPILFVLEPSRSREFYRRVLAMEPRLDVPGMIEFQISSGCCLGLMPVAGARRLLALDLVDAPLAPTGELYLYVDRPERYLDRVVAAGGRIVSPLAHRDWGDRAGYALDPDGHLLAFAQKG